MHRIFLAPEQFQGDTVEIGGNDHQHLAKVLRMRVGEAVVLLNNRGQAYQATIREIGKNATQAHIESELEFPPEPPIFLTVAQALGKGDKLEQVIQHGTEAGASAFVPIRAERCIADIPAAKVAERIGRYQQIAKGAAEQSGRLLIPQIELPLTTAQLFARHAPGCPVWLLHPDAESVPLKILLSQSHVETAILAVGPEGGWSRTEESQARTANIPLVTLGSRILRTETAALVAISQILYHFEK